MQYPERLKGTHEPFGQFVKSLLMNSGTKLSQACTHTLEVQSWPTGFPDSPQIRPNFVIKAPCA